MKLLNPFHALTSALPDAVWRQTIILAACVAIAPAVVGGWGGGAAWAVGDAAGQAAAPAAQTLVEALAGARVPGGVPVVLSVGAKWVNLPKAEENGDEGGSGVGPVPPGASVARVARRFDQLMRTVGSVVVVAPRTMVRINTAPGKPNIYAGMPTNDVLTLLLATLSDGQWAAVTGEEGLALSTLTTEDQRMLVKALLPKGALTVVPYYYTYHPDYKKEDIRDLSDSLPEARLRLSQSYSIGFPAKDNPRSAFQSNDIPPAPGGPPHYKLTNREIYGGSQETLYGVPIRETVPNVEKANQLPVRDARLDQGVDPTGAKTVGELVARIAEATGLALYVDQHYAERPLTILANPATGAAVRARDLLRALAVCNTATYRRLGGAGEAKPAWVLTDDLVGMGTRQAIWYEFEKDGDALRAAPVAEAAQSLYTRFGGRGVKAYGDDAALGTSGGKGVAAPPKDMQDALNAISQDDDYPAYVHKPFGELTPAQQGAVQRVVAEHNLAYTNQPGLAGGTIQMYPEIRVELLLPTLPTPIDLDLKESPSLLFRQSAAIKAQRRAEQSARFQEAANKFYADHPEARGPKRETAPALAPLLPAPPPPPRRAVILTPGSSAELGADIAAMQTMGLNELWLDLPFRRDMGKQNAAASSAAGDAAVAPNSPDALLAEALRVTANSGIRVFAVVSPFAHDAAVSAAFVPPTAASSTIGKASHGSFPVAPSSDAALWDLDLIGQTSADAERHVQERQLLLSNDGYGHGDEDSERPIPPVYDNPLAPGFQEATEALIRRLAAHPAGSAGIAGIVLRQTDPPGYDAVRGGDDMSRRLLGYNEAMRLAFLRQHHTDPIDLFTPNYYSGKADTRVPIQRYTNENDRYQAWMKFRREQNLVFLRGLFASADGLPILVHQRRRGPSFGFSEGKHGYLPGWYGSWDAPGKALPTFRSAGDSYNLGSADKGVSEEPSYDPNVQANAESQVSLSILTVSDFLSRRAMRTAPQRNPQAPVLRDDGFVLDLSFADLPFGLHGTEPEVVTLPHTLPDLAEWTTHHLRE